jgi:hypothetical protein
MSLAAPCLGIGTRVCPATAKTANYHDGYWTRKAAEERKSRSLVNGTLVEQL